MVLNCSNVWESAAQVPNAAAHVIEKISFALMLALVIRVRIFFGIIKVNVYF